MAKTVGLNKQEKEVSMKFPLNLGNIKSGKLNNRFITFHFYSYDVIKTAIEGLNNILTKAAETAVSSETETDTKIKQEKSSASSFLSTIKKSAENRLSKKLTSKDAPSNKKIYEKSIALPLPNELSETMEHNWSEETGLVSDLIGKALPPDGGIQTFSNKISAFLGARNVITNPDYVQLYKGSTPRQMTFTWTLIPNNTDEAKQIFNIIKHFKAYSSGELGKTRGVFLTAPKFCNVEIHNEILKDALKIDNMVIKSVNVNYSGEGNLEMYHDGMPKSIVLSISLAERTVKTKEDWLNSVSSKEETNETKNKSN